MATQDKLVSLGMWPTLAAALEGDWATAVTATGATQATAVLLTADTTMFSTVAASTGAVLRPVVGRQIVFNGGANALLVYPPVGGKVNALATNAGFSQAAGKVAEFVSPDGVIFIALLSA
nr:hypothetical protein [uncultured Undibacterium sp.]